MDPLISRHIRGDVDDALGVSRIVAIVGPRQSGKSTLAALIVRETLNTSLVTFDDDATRAFAQNDPAGFVGSLSLPIALDEVQRAPGVMLAIKSVVDRDTRPGRFLITGSADLRVLPTIPDALPGRVEYLNLWPFSQGELTGTVETFIDRIAAGRPPSVDGAPTGVGGYADRITAGGYPGALALSPRRRAGFFDSYLTSLLGRQIGEISTIRRPDTLEKLLRLLAARPGSLLNRASLATELGFDAKTVDSYIQLLRQLGLVIVVPAWHSNLGHRIIKAPKVHIADSGLLTHLIGADPVALTGNPTAAGPVVETFVLNELVRQSGWAAQPPIIHHFRTHSGSEVDIVLEWRDGRVAGIEVKSAASLSTRDTRGLVRMRDALGERFVAGIVIYTGERTVAAGNRLWAVPLEAIWSAQ